MGRLAQFGALLSIAACSPKSTAADGPGDSTASASSSATTSDASTDSGDGSGETGDVGCVFLPMTECDIVEVPCMPAELLTAECGGEEILLGSDHQCVSRALRDDTPAWVFINTASGDMVSASCGSNDFIVLLGDGTAIMNRVGGSEILIASRRVEVRPPEFFEPCVDSDDPATVVACLTDWFVPDSCVPELCCPGPNEAGHPLCD